MAKGQYEKIISRPIRSLFDTVIFRDRNCQNFVLKNRGDIEEGEFQYYSLSAIRQIQIGTNEFDRLIEMKMMFVKRGEPLNILIVE